MVHHTIDSPGEYMERRSLLSALVVASVEADLVLFLQDASQERFLYSQGQSAAFPVPVAGVLSLIHIWPSPGRGTRPGPIFWKGSTGCPAVCTSSCAAGFPVIMRGRTSHELFQ